MLEVYYKYRCKYQDYIIFIKSGSFYEVFDKDSMILNSIFYYKVKRFKDNVKTGFPINKLEHIIKLMGNINYIVIDNDNIVDEKVFSDNKYDSYTFDINTIVVNSIKIDKLTKVLNEKLLDKNISNIIKSIEEIIGKNI